ncbi:two-component system, OmpR family, KDP operon response regulator KdpE [Dehalogenimonas formicexedens]|uniref:Two-component system, OmpR family, KDP operon response regulator KdpE n=1 Tax=Dehalogenimonas formicexedens TaxID=1839801 RepID=A0A1P8F9Y4_9CHLR|nr:response regulator transcription factor [Dehalogenimonas formicexedens]APV45248.1 two-component system, OmpR family, KDP operon response regulator KdpE [Dehalogenimonas formicexedens]
MKILVIEDDRDIVDFISLALGIGWPGIEIEVADTGEKGIDMAGKVKPDVVTVDLGLPGLNGFEVIKSIRVFSKVPIIVLTVRGEEKDIVRGLELGADEYVVKPFGQMELIARIRALIRRNQAKGELKPLVYGSLTFDAAKRLVNTGGRDTILTTTEANILEQLMSKPGETATHSAIAEKLWGSNYPEASEAIKVHIRHIREKIESDPGKPQIILTRFGVGYYLAKPV